MIPRQDGCLGRGCSRVSSLNVPGGPTRLLFPPPLTGASPRLPPTVVFVHVVMLGLSAWQSFQVPCPSGNRLRVQLEPFLDILKRSLKFLGLLGAFGTRFCLPAQNPDSRFLGRSKSGSPVFCFLYRTVQSDAPPRLCGEQGGCSHVFVASNGMDPESPH